MPVSKIITSKRERIHKARKKHKCSKCHRDIEIGENYQRITYSITNEFRSENICSDCNNSIPKINKTNSKTKNKMKFITRK